METNKGVIHRATDIQGALTNSATAERKADEQAGRLKSGLNSSLAAPTTMPAKPIATTRTIKKEGKTIVMNVEPSAATIARYNAEVGRFSRLFANLDSRAILGKRKLLRDSADISRAEYATALKMPAALETCTKLIGG